MVFTENLFQQINAVEGNRLVRSRLKFFEGKTNSSALSIKMPLNGTEYYQVDQEYFRVNSGSFLLVNQGQKVTCKVNSSKSVDSFCIYLDYHNFNEIYSNLLQPDWLGERTNRLEPEVVTNIYKLDSNPFGKFLPYPESPVSQFTEEDFILLTEKLARHQLDFRKSIDRIKAKQITTKKELLRRLEIARSFIYDNFNQEISLSAISAAACLSKYYLLRAFRDYYGVTPYQMLLHRRIEKAKEMLSQGNPVLEVALECGFNDHRSFSRAFKKMVGVLPSAI